jgi:hypothetical protein
MPLQLPAPMIAIYRRERSRPIRAATNAVSSRPFPRCRRRLCGRPDVAIAIIEPEMPSSLGNPAASDAIAREAKVMDAKRTVDAPVGGGIARQVACWRLYGVSRDLRQFAWSLPRLPGVRLLSGIDATPVNKG